MGVSPVPISVLEGLFLKDDFLTNDSVADGVVGELDWEIGTIGNASTLALENGEVGAPGILKMTTAATADGDGATLTLHPDTILLDKQPGYFVFKARLDDQIASNNFRIGIIAGSPTSATVTDGIYVDCNGGVITLYADSADHGDKSAAAAGVSTLTSGTTMVVTTWHKFEVRWGGRANAQGGPSEAHLFVDGELACSILNVAIDDDETMEPNIIHWQDSGGALAVELDLDYYELFISRAP